MINKYIKYVIALTSVLTIASTSSKMNVKADSNQDKINEINSQVNKLTADIKDNQNKIDDLIKDEAKNSKLIVHYQDQKSKMKLDLNNKARAYQTYQNNGGLIGTFLESKNITEALSASIQANQMMKSVQSSIDETTKLEQSTKKVIEDDKIQYDNLQSAKKDLNSQISDLQNQVTYLNKIIEQKNVTSNEQIQSKNITNVVNNAIDTVKQLTGQQVANEKNTSEGVPNYDNSSSNTSSNNNSNTQPTPQPNPDTTPQPESQIYNGPWSTQPKYGIGFSDGECTRGVSILKDGRVPLNWGDARFWTANAQKSGIPTGIKPAVGAIVCWQPGENMGGFMAGPYGHVAVVTSANADGSYNIKEMNGIAGWNNFGDRSASGGTFIYIR